jgi:hypothetical protein
VSCALTVAVTRFFLGSLAIRTIRRFTWPTLYGADWHCSFAGIMARLVQNRGATVVHALLTGAVSFVDEVGKFITQKNDYFFPLAAPIVYASLLLILVPFIAAARARVPGAGHTRSAEVAR